MYCIETNGLSHRFAGGDLILNNINLQVPSGSIFGFLGPNGAGKTTTLRLLLGLLRKQNGNISIFNKPFDTNRVEILSKTGTLIESPSLYSHLTARENLLLLQKIYQCDKKRIDEVLELVDLSKTEKKKAGKFSLGMKQRLGIAMALLHNPSLLVLDEPTNGLDPNGMMEVRELLKRINANGETTILISSHILAEIEKLVSHVGIIHKGELLFQGTLDSLHHMQSQSAMVRVETNNPPETKKVLASFNIDATENNMFVNFSLTHKEQVALINAELVKRNIAVYELTHVKNDLESIFMNLVKN